MTGTRRSIRRLTVQDAMAAERITVQEKDAHGDALAQVARALRDGALVIFPTETVYGIAASAADPAAVARLRAAKKRRDSQPFTVHIGDPQDAAAFVPEPPPVAVHLARRAWPGPLTLVFREVAADAAPVLREHPQARQQVYRDDSVGLRCPDHAVARELLRAAGVPVVASSANVAGARPPADADQAAEQLGEQADWIVDAGPARYRSASTIVEVGSQGLTILRTGVLDERTIRRMAVRRILLVCTGNSCRSPLAEYMLRQALAKRLGIDPEALENAGYAVTSAGTAAMTGAPMSSGSLEALRRRGIDGSTHRSQPLSEMLIREADRIWCMSPEHREAVLARVPGAAARTELFDPAGAVFDPIGQGPEVYERCAQHIETLVARRVKELVDEDRTW